MRIDANGDVLAQLEDSVVLLAHEAQSAFAERYAEYDWRVDLSDVPVLWFEREPRAVFRAHFVGSVSGGSSTWLWGWENINGFPDAAVETARSVRDLGEQAGVELLTTPKLSVPESDDALVHSLVRAAMAVSGIPTHYRAPTGPGSFAWFLVDNPAEFALDAPSPVTIASMTAELLGAGLITDPRRALADYAERRGGIEYAEGEDGAVITLTMAAGSTTARLDEQGRIVELVASA